MLSKGLLSACLVWAQLTLVDSVTLVDSWLKEMCETVDGGYYAPESPTLCLPRMVTP